MLLAMTRAHHQRACLRHGIAYRYDHTPRPVRERTGGKVYAILDWLESAQDGDLGIYLDSDALWVQPEISLADCAWRYGLGMVRGRNGQLNSGAIYMRAGQPVRDIMREWQRWNAELNGCTEQQVLNDILNANCDAAAMEIDSGWNRFGLAAHAPRGPIIVRSWQGEAPRCAFNGLRAALLSMP